MYVGEVKRMVRLTEGSTAMRTTTTLAEVLDTLSLTDADEVDVIEEAAIAVIRKGTAQMVVIREDDRPGAFTVITHDHESEDDARTCHAYKVGVVRNPMGAFLSQMFGQAFDAPAGGDTFYV